MEIRLEYAQTHYKDSQVQVYATFSKADKAVFSNIDKALVELAKKTKQFESFKAAKGSKLQFIDECGCQVVFLGMGEKTKLTTEMMRRELAKVVKAYRDSNQSIAIALDTLATKASMEKFVGMFTETALMTAYKFTEYKSKSESQKLEEVVLFTKEKKTVARKMTAAIESATNMADSINLARDFVNTPPNVLRSNVYAKRIQDDVKKNLKGVKYKVLGKAELQKRKAGCFLSVNDGSGFPPQLVHLTYTPKRVTKNTKHIALVGKGLVFDSGGYSLKPAGSMVNMKFDMAGSSTVYGAFRAAVLNGADVKLSCFLGITDNAVNEKATYPDSIVTASNGKTVEILNTDAEGRLVLADTLVYASEHEPDVIIDAATLTGACLVAVGHETCAIMGNDQKLTDKLLKSAGNVDERMWQLPIFDEFRDDMKSPIADLKNIGGSRFGGTAKAAAFLEEFVGEGISWAHLDIAGIGDGQGHLPYCPPKGGSGLVVRSIVDYIFNSK